jgi:hypothetical protein
LKFEIFRVALNPQPSLEYFFETHKRNTPLMLFKKATGLSQVAWRGHHPQAGNGGKIEI